MIRRLTLVAALTAVAWSLFAAAVPGGARAVTPYQDIASAGPLEDVYLGNDLACQIRHTGDAALEFFPPGTIPGDCGTFVALGGTLYAPNFPAHGPTATASLGVYIPFTPVSQSGVTGTGTAADPFKVVTVVDVAATGLRIQQTDSYVVGDEAYRTDVTILNSAASAASGVLYRAADCFLGGSDFGYGFTEAFGTRKAVGCSVNPNNAPPGRIEEWVPLTGGNNFYHDFFANVWSWIGGKTPFPNTCQCTTLLDNGAGLSWNFSVGAGASITFSHVTTFSPTGKQALATSKTADSPSSPAGAQNGYTITIPNPNPDPVTLNSITDTLPTGFSYIAGSTTGVTTSDPVVSGQILTWSGPFTVPADGSVSLHFSVTVANTPGDYFNEAGGDAADGYTVLGTGPTAQITVAGAGAPATLTLSPKTDTNTAGDAHIVTAMVTDANGNPTPGIVVDFAITGANGPLNLSATTDANGVATISYIGFHAGDDTIAATAEGGSNPSDTATKTWVASTPAGLTLSPKTGTNPVGTEHCVTATVTDEFGNPVVGQPVDFVVTGANPHFPLTQVQTDTSGQAQFCYVGTLVGNDEISATVHNASASPPSDTAQKTWITGTPATLDLTPETATNIAGDQHCVVATVKDQFGNPTPGITVEFSVTGSVTTSGSAVTDANGQATFCYTGPALPGADVITAFADTNGNGVQDPGEPGDSATKSWVIPPNNEACKVTYGGRIMAANGDKATFGGNAKGVGPAGQEEYQDHGPAVDMNVHSIDVRSVTCSTDGTSASIFGTATIDGAGTWDYRIDMTDPAAPGPDTYRIRLSNGYESGIQALSGGNVQIH